MSEQQNNQKKGPVEEVIPEFVQRRLDIFKAIADRTPKAEPQEIEAELLPINTTAKNVEGKKIKITAGVTTPLQIAQEHYPKQVFFAAQCGENLIDLTRPINESCKISFIDFEDARGKEVFWHSSAHVLGAAIELHLGVEIAIGPATERGFFYDFEPKADQKVTEETLKEIQSRCEKICKKKGDFERKMVTREEALEIFSSNHYKTEILTSRVQPGELVSLYRTGTFIDLCRGPHMINASPINQWWVIDVSACIWNGQADRKMMRIRGITFPSKELMQEHKKFLEEVAKRDHRKLGTDLDLFFFHPWSPGCAFFYPAGASMYHRLMGMIREEYIKRHFVEVITPNLYYDDLFKTSGHWAHYRDDMFHFKIDDGAQPEAELEGQCTCCDREMGVKPMNCPGHCLLFRSRVRSYRDLPIRMAEFGVIHRNEATGALTGLTRVRRFVQDDAHIFCRVDQIGTEINDAIDFMIKVYSYFGMDLEFTLSTINMEKYMGDLKVWEDATELLRKALIQHGKPFIEAPGEAAFYGPKIDVLIRDCLGRRHQLATIQLDFQLPEKFKLEYVDSETHPHRPVMIHRAVLGSLERFLAIAIEHFAGKFPFWVSPYQVSVVPQNQKQEHQMEYCRKVYESIHLAGFQVQFLDGSESMNKKIVNSFKIGTNVVLIIGDREVENGTVSARWRGEEKVTSIPLQEFMNQILAMSKNYQ